MGAKDAARPRGHLDVNCRLLRSDGARLQHRARSVPVDNSGYCIVEWFGTSTGVQVLGAFQERQTVRVAECQHRTRNLNAVVRSIAAQTVAATASDDAFAAEFNDRMAALARVQGSLSCAEEEPITLGAPIRLELDAKGAGDGSAERVTLDGPPVRIRHSVAQTLAPALHQLATNARKHGAPATDEDRLRVGRNTQRVDGSRRLALEWAEEGGSAPGVARRHGFGRELIEYALPHASDAPATNEVGVRCTIDMPLENGRTPHA